MKTSMMKSVQNSFWWQLLIKETPINFIIYLFDYCLAPAKNLCAIAFFLCLIYYMHFSTGYFSECPFLSNRWASHRWLRSLLVVNFILCSFSPDLAKQSKVRVQKEKKSKTDPGSSYATLCSIASILYIICYLLYENLPHLPLSSCWLRSLLVNFMLCSLSPDLAKQSKTDPGSSYATRCWDALPNDVQRDVISKLPRESQMRLRLTSKKNLTLTWTNYHPYRPISDLLLVVNLVTLSLFMKPRVKVFETLSLLRKRSQTDNMAVKYLQVFAASARECFSRGVKYIYSFTKEKVEKMIAQGGAVDDAHPDIVSAPPMNEETDSSVWMEYISSPKEEQGN